jgi:hypothetical protein
MSVINNSANRVKLIGLQTRFGAKLVMLGDYAGSQQQRGF